MSRRFVIRRGAARGSVAFFKWQASSPQRAADSRNGAPVMKGWTGDTHTHTLGDSHSARVPL